MNRLQSELHRLYFPLSKAGAEAGTQPSALIDTSGKVRAMVMELRGPPGWDALSRVWQGVQAELGLPAPAIAVSGIDGLQLWFSVAEPIAVAQAHAFLDRLRQRFLSDVEPGRVRLMPALDASALRQELHAPLVPALQDTGNWSAFLAPDLVPIFADTPWLDTPPNDEGQATLLRAIKVMAPATFDAACQQLGTATAASRSNVVIAGSVDKPRANPLAGERSEAAGADGPKGFLLNVMNDDTVALALRIEAAKVLLQHARDKR
jgi:hypothetical protein